jgi:hypothetical protein
MLLAIHIAAGGLAIVLGAAALLARKGGTIHRRSGLLFAGAMLALGTSAAILGFRKTGPTDSNVFGGLMTAYFVITALTTVRPVSRWTRSINVAALTVAVVLAIVDILGGVKAFNSPRGVLNGAPFFMLFFIATVMILAAIGDVRILRFGMPRGGPRLARHLLFSFRMISDTRIECRNANSEGETARIGPTIPNRGGVEPGSAGALGLDGFLRSPPQRGAYLPSLRHQSPDVLSLATSL